MGEHDDRRLRLDLLEIGLQPGDLGVAHHGLGVGDIVERDEVHALVIEGVVGLAEELLVRFALVESGIVLAGQEADGLDLQAGGDVAKLVEPRGGALSDRRSCA